MPESTEKNPTKGIDCFICQPQPVNLAAEKPYRWLSPALACARHKAEAVLENGQPLALFLTSSDNGGLPPEESGFNYMLNPVFIEGVRGWCDFSVGGLAVHSAPGDSRFLPLLGTARLCPGHLRQLYRPAPRRRLRASSL